MGFASLSRFQSAIKVDCVDFQKSSNMRYEDIAASKIGTNLKPSKILCIMSKQCNNVENRDHVSSKNVF